MLRSRIPAAFTPVVLWAGLAPACGGHVVLDTAGGSGGAPAMTASGGSGGGCDANNCAEQGLACCGGACVDLRDDPYNCGTCGKRCVGGGGSAPTYCNAGTCTVPPPCENFGCQATEVCCGASCCAEGELCCDVPGPISSGPGCYAPVNGTCPVGCPDCK